MDNEAIGAALVEMVDGGFSVDAFSLYKVGHDGPIYYVAIQSSPLRDTPELNGRVCKGETFGEAMQKAVNVARYIIKQS